jgi:hypothetical protein
VAERANGPSDSGRAGGGDRGWVPVGRASGGDSPGSGGRGPGGGGFRGRLEEPSPYTQARPQFRRCDEKFDCLPIERSALKGQSQAGGVPEEAHRKPPKRDSEREAVPETNRIRCATFGFAVDRRRAPRTAPLNLALLTTDGVGEMRAVVWLRESALGAGLLSGFGSVA